MRLLDRVAHCRTPLRLALNRDPRRVFGVTGPSDFARLVAQCPHRFILGDDLTRACAELAFAAGARLAGCLDLLRVPAPLTWVEWNDDIHNRVVHESGSAPDYDPGARGRRVGVLLRGSPAGETVVLHTFWTDRDVHLNADVVLSLVETLIDLRGPPARGASLIEVLSGGFASVTDERNDAMATLLDHVRFRLDDRWADYYRAAATTTAEQSEAVKDCLAAVARDAPLLLAFFLLLNARDATRSIPIAREAINRKRLSRGQLPLLDHVEVRASLEAIKTHDDTACGSGTRQSPRLHHVRGHLVRRDNRVFWRTPHLRGSAVRGLAHSRTVCLSFGRRPAVGSTGAPRSRVAESNTAASTAQPHLH